MTACIVSMGALALLFAAAVIVVIVFYEREARHIDRAQKLRRWVGERY